MASAREKRKKKNHIMNGVREPHLIFSAGTGPIGYMTVRFFRGSDVSRGR